MSAARSRRYLVTGGLGFLGSVLVRRLVQVGHRVRILDNQSRGSLERVNRGLAEGVEVIDGDVRDTETVQRAVRGVDSVCHLAFVNGTRLFYTKPELVLDVGVKGIVQVIEACQRHGVGELVVVSSSEVYQTPPRIPTAEEVPLSIPDPLNPRYSYAAAKIISEVMAINYGRTSFERVLIVRPHNVYGPDMGWEHVIPQLTLRMRALRQEAADPVPLPIQGTGQETRAFVFIEDFIDGLMLVLERGAHLGIYHIGTTEELTIERVAQLVGEYFGRRVRVVPGQAAAGGPLRRCPAITKLTALGYRPRWSFREGLAVTAKWYDEHAELAPALQATAWA